MLPGDFLQVSASRSSVAQGIDDNSKGAGPRDRSRVSPTLGATLVAQSVIWALWPVCRTQPPPATFSKSIPLLHTPPKLVPLIHITFICIETFHSMVLQCSGFQRMKVFQTSYFV
jgi:hypothetical protein